MARTIRVEFVGSARDLEAAAAAAAEAVAAFGATADATQTSLSGWQQASNALTAATTALGSAGALVIPILVGLGAVIAFALTPAIAFLVGEMGALALGALPLFALGGLAYVFITLEQRVGALSGMTKKLTDDFTKAEQEVAQRVAPALNLLFAWLDKLIPKGQEFADRAAGWFRSELPSALAELQGVFDSVGKTVEGIISDIGKAFDNQLGHPKSFQDAVQKAMDQVRGAIDQLLVWLARLSAWWETDGKRFAADAQTDFTVLARVIDILASVFGVLADAADRAGRAISAVGTAVHTVISSGLGAGAGAAAQLGGLGGLGGFFQHGGTAAAGTWYVAGEAGPELAYARPGGGVTVFPNGGGPPGARGPYNTTFYISGAGNPEAVAGAVDRRLSQLLTST